MVAEALKSQGFRVCCLGVKDHADPQLEERYGRSIPVLHIGGRLAFKGRLEVAELRKKFARLAREWERAGEPA